MTNFPKPTDEDVLSLLDDSREALLELAEEMKISNLNEDFLKEIVIPISLFLNQQFSSENHIEVCRALPKSLGNNFIK